MYAASFTILQAAYRSVAKTQQHAAVCPVQAFAPGAFGRTDQATHASFHGSNDCVKTGLCRGLTSHFASYCIKVGRQFAQRVPGHKHDLRSCGIIQSKARARLGAG